MMNVLVVGTMWLGKDLEFGLDVMLGVSCPFKIYCLGFARSLSFMRVKILSWVCCRRHSLVA